MNPHETRARDGLELRTATDGGGVVVGGYAAVFDEDYDVHDMLGAYTERVSPGAFTRTLNAGADVRFLIDHEGLPLARTRSGTMTLAQDDHGLVVEATLDAASPVVVALRSAIARRDMDQMSFAFVATRQEWDSDYSHRMIVEAKLFDVSAVAFPASPTTSIGLRSAVTARYGRAVWNDIRAGLPIDPTPADVRALLRGDTCPGRARALAFRVAV